MPIVCTCKPLMCLSFVTRMYSCIICLYLYVIGRSLLCTWISAAYHSYVIVYTGMSLVCTRMSSVCHSYTYSYVTRMSPVFHSYLLACHPYVTHMYSYAICMSLVCCLTINRVLLLKRQIRTEPSTFCHLCFI